MIFINVASCEAVGAPKSLTTLFLTSGWGGGVEVKVKVKLRAALIQKLHMINVQMVDLRKFEMLFLL